MEVLGDKYWKKCVNLYIIKFVVLFVSLLLKLINKKSGIVSIFIIILLIVRCNMKWFMIDLSFFVFSIIVIISLLLMNLIKEVMLR